MVGTFLFIVGVLCLFVVSFIGSSSLVTSSVRSALDNINVRRAIAEELVAKLETGGDSGERITIRVAHSKVIEEVEASLRGSNLRDAAGDVAATVYDVYIEGKPPATVDIQIFADEAFRVIQTIDPSVPNGLSPRLDPLEISRSGDSPDLASIRSWILLVPWIFMVVGLVLLAISWLISEARKWLRVRRIGIRFLFGGLVLIILTYVARGVSLGDSSSSRIAEALVLFATNRLIIWSIILTAVGVVVAAFGAVMDHRVASG